MAANNLPPKKSKTLQKKDLVIFSLLGFNLLLTASIIWAFRQYYEVNNTTFMAQSSYTFKQSRKISELEACLKYSIKDCTTENVNKAVDQDPNSK